MPWCFGDEVTPHTRKALAYAGSHGLVVPSIWPWEISNVLLQAERKGRVSAQQVAEFRLLLQGLTIRIVPCGVQDALGPVAALGRKHRLTSYDAAYVALSLQFKLPLATKDVAMAEAAVKEGVQLFT